MINKKGPINCQQSRLLSLRLCEGVSVHIKSKVVHLPGKKYKDQCRSRHVDLLLKSDANLFIFHPLFSFLVRLFSRLCL